jgi:membrane protease YdiL (CAAX protease family)
LGAVQYGPQYGHETAFPHPPPPDPPERPEGIDPFPRWPAWYGPAAFGTGLVVMFIAQVFVAVIRGAAGGDPGHISPALAQILTVVLDAIFVSAAILFASRTARPRPEHFGLRRAPFWRTVGWAALGMVTFLVVAVIYSNLVNDHGQQSIVKELGAKDSTVALVAGAVLVIVIAPSAEEFFFRGFFYRALRSRLAVLPAALLDGLLFGVIHYDGPKTAVLLPVLALLGFVFCLVYERTGTLFSTIALHSLNNFVAYAGGTDNWGVAGAVGGAMLTACIVLPRIIDARGTRTGAAAAATAAVR